MIPAMSPMPFRRSLPFILLLAVLSAVAVVGQETGLVEEGATAVEPEVERPEVEVPETGGDKVPPTRKLDREFVAQEAADLRVWNRHIATLRARMADMEPDERAVRAAETITSLSDDLLEEEVWSEPSQIRGVDYVLVGVSNQVLLPLRTEDLDPGSDQTLEELGAEAAERIQAVLVAQAQQRHWPTILRNAALGLLATTLFVVFTLGVFKYRYRFKDRLVARLNRRKLQISGFDLKPHLSNSTRVLAVFASWLLILPAAYIWLTLVLGLFPYTKPWADGLGHYLVELVSDLSLGAVAAIPGLFTVFLIFLINRFLTRIVEAFFVSVETEALHVHWLQPETAKATRRLVIVVMWIFALTVAYPYIPGSNSSAFKGVSVFVGLMVSLGATGLVNQIVSGMVIVYTKAFRPGEFVRIDDTEGFVDEIGVLSTKIKTLRHEHITIPNAVLVGTSVNNFSRNSAAQGSVIGTSVTIGYDVPWRQVHALLELAADRCDDIQKEPAPRVLQRGLSDFYVEYTLLVNIADPSQRYLVSSVLHGQIQDAFNEHGVQIMSPHYLDRAEEPIVIPETGWSAPPADPATD